MVVFEKPKALTDAPLHYCPGCTHGIIHRLVAEALDELGVTGKLSALRL
jgi:2-oxoglutarate ferredoxin oxidoreductase subunit beta